MYMLYKSGHAPATPLSAGAVLYILRPPGSPEWNLNHGTESFSMGGPVFGGRGRGLQLSVCWAALGVYEARAVVVRAEGPRAAPAPAGAGRRTEVQALKSSFMLDLTEDLTEHPTVYTE
ncbi:unnamed protein product [Boreogadus saida]